jgi:uncharacterized protein (TIGR03435 family)
VASIRRSNPDQTFIQARTPSLRADAKGNVSFIQTSIVNMIMMAYNVGAPQIEGPDWLSAKQLANADHFDVVARVPDGSTPDQVPLMLQSLLAERFHLSFHEETTTLSVYALTVAKGGPKMKEAPADAEGEGVCERSFAETPGATLAAACTRISGADLGQQIQALAPGYFREGPVVNMTDLKGSYDFKLEWITVEQFRQGSDGPSMFEAVEKQLGLKLENRKQPLPILKIDRVDRMPTEN